MRVLDFEVPEGTTLQEASVATILCAMARLDGHPRSWIFDERKARMIGNELFVTRMNPIVDAIWPQTEAFTRADLEVIIDAVYFDGLTRRLSNH